MKRASDWPKSIGERRVEQSREGMCNFEPCAMGGLASRSLAAFAKFQGLLILRDESERTPYNEANPGLSLKTRSWGFPPASTSMTAGYFHNKQREK